MALVEELIGQGWLKSPRIIEAFKNIKRVDFMPEGSKDLAELNTALPIGYRQTISQPLVVAFMLEQLDPRLGNKILDVGSGSGWTSALLAYLVGPEGKVIALEIIPELKEFGEKNVSKYNFIKEKRVEFVLADGSKGYEKEKPYDRILTSASGQSLPQAFKGQLKEGGKIVIPIKSSIWVFTKNPSGGGKDEFEEKEYPGFAFVPLITFKD